MKFSMKKCAVGVAAAIAMGAGTTAANAAPALISVAFALDGGGTVFQLPLDSPGSKSFSGAFGDFGTIQISANGAGVAAPPHVFDSNTLGVNQTAGGNHVLSIYVTSINNVAPSTNTAGMANFTSSFAENGNLTAGWTVNEQTFVDASNTRFGTATPLGAATFASVGATGQVASSVMLGFAGTPATWALTGGYAVTEVYTITSVGPGSASSAVNLAVAIPEPETYAMMLAGLGFMGFIARHRKKMAVA